jgi:hypothetical protein
VSLALGIDQFAIAYKKALWDTDEEMGPHLLFAHCSDIKGSWYSQMREFRVQRNGAYLRLARGVPARERFSRTSKLDEAAECGDTRSLLGTLRATDRQGNRRVSEDQEACLSALVAPFGRNAPA